MCNLVNAFSSTRRTIALFIVAAVCGCGGGESCEPFLLVPDPTGRWSGVMVREESDCGDASQGEQFSFKHDVSTECDSNSDSDITLVDEQNRSYQETTSSSLGGGSFTVQHESSGTTIDISYENYDGSLADVTVKIRRYENGQIRCSERYKGQARK